MKSETYWPDSPAVWAALLASGLSVLPGLLARLAQGAGWVSVVVALPAAMLLGRAARQGGSPGRYALCPGAWGGALTIIYIMCAVALLSVRLRLGSQRLAVTAQGGAEWWIFLLVLAGCALWIGRGTREAFVRAASVFWSVLLCVLAVVCLLSVLRLRPEFLWPAGTQELPGILAGAACVLGVFGVGAYAAFLLPEQPVGRKVGAGLGGGVQAVAVACVLGSLGPALAGRLSDPWITLARGIGVEGAVRRLDSLVSAAWLLADLAYLGLLLQAGRRLCSRWFGRRERWYVLSATVTAILLALTLLREEETARRVQRWMEPGVGLLVGVVLPLASWGISCVARQKERHI